MRLLRPQDFKRKDGKMKTELEPWEADHLYHRLKQVENSGGEACKHGVCPASLGDMNVGNRECSICRKLFPGYRLHPEDQFSFAYFNGGVCPCYDSIMKHMVLDRVKEALENYYTTHKFVKEADGIQDQG